MTAEIESWDEEKDAELVLFSFSFSFEDVVYMTLLIKSDFINI